MNEPRTSSDRKEVGRGAGQHLPRLPNKPDRRSCPGQAGAAPSGQARSYQTHRGTGTGSFDDQALLRQRQRDAGGCGGEEELGRLETTRAGCPGTNGRARLGSPQGRRLRFHQRGFGRRSPGMEAGALHAETALSRPTAAALATRMAFSLGSPTLRGGMRAAVQLGRARWPLEMRRGDILFDWYEGSSSSMDRHPEATGRLAGRQAPGFFPPVTGSLAALALQLAQLAAE